LNSLAELPEGKEDVEASTNPLPLDKESHLHSCLLFPLSIVLAAVAAVKDDNEELPDPAEAVE
jgi:hypothetical protein